MMVQLRRIWIQLSSNRRQFVILCAALGVALLLWARIIVISNVPRTAIADDNAASEEFSDLSSSRDASGNQVVDDVQYVRLSRMPQRDPFVISNEHFPAPKVVDDRTKEQGKLALEAVEDSEARRFTLLQAKVKGLTLEAVMSGPPPMAVIDGRTYRIGDEVQAGDSGGTSLTLVEVGPRRAVLEQDGHQFILEMPTPMHR